MLDRLKYWFVPQGWSNLISKIGQKAGAGHGYKNVQFDAEKLKAFKGIHKGERCFILASGPSINKQDLKPLKDEYCIAVSQFFLHPDIEIIKPEYHCFAPQHEPFDDDTNKIIFDNYTKHYTFPIKAFIGTSDYEYSYFNYLSKHPECKVDATFINYQQAPHMDESNYLDSELWNLDKHPFGLSTVIYTAIQVAYYLGFSEIYLLGVDHDYLNDLDRSDGHHFYDDKKSYSDKEHLSKISKEKWFYIYYSRWMQYRLMMQFLNKHGVQIYNASPGSYLDVFPFADYNDTISNKTNG